MDTVLCAYEETNNECATRERNEPSFLPCLLRINQSKLLQSAKKRRGQQLERKDTLLSLLGFTLPSPKTPGQMKCSDYKLSFVSLFSSFPIHLQSSSSNHASILYRPYSLSNPSSSPVHSSVPIYHVLPDVCPGNGRRISFGRKERICCDHQPAQQQHTRGRARASTSCLAGWYSTNLVFSVSHTATYCFCLIPPTKLSFWVSYKIESTMSSCHIDFQS